MTSPFRIAMLFFVFLFASLSAFAADYPEPNQGDWVVRDFRFHSGEVLPELRLHYTTVGAPTGEPSWRVQHDRHCELAFDVEGTCLDNRTNSLS